MVETVVQSIENQVESINKDGRTKNTSHPSDNDPMDVIEAQSNGNRVGSVKVDDKMDAKENTSPRCSEEPPNDKNEVCTVMKTRQRGECKDTVRIIFTGITATHRHMQVC